MRPHPLALLAVLTLLLPTAPAHAAQPTGKHERTSPAVHEAKKRVPALRVKRLVGGLDNPWDVQSIDRGQFLFTQRDRATLSLWKKGKTRKVRFPSGKVWVSGETGLMGLEVDPDFAQNRRIYTCQGGFTEGGHDVRVMAWRLDGKARKVTNGKQLIGGFPATSGRHGGCRLHIASDGSLLVGTGDAAVGTNPRNLDSLGGKTLRLDRFTGAPWPSNPFADGEGNRRFVHTFGHRNVQGLAERADGSLWSIEQGSDRDDEVNLLVKGGDYGWNPVPGYNESVPMTDQSLPGDQQEARWRSGDSTLATSGGTFVEGRKWGKLKGALAVACLKASRVLFLSFDAAGALTKVRVPRALRGHGRIRQVSNTPKGGLLVTTDNGGGRDAILLVTPR